jgi:KDO2-lipid IV(A) lauroyltransferase
MRLFLIKTVLRAVGILPLPVIHSLGCLLGWTHTLIPNRLRRDTCTNIKLCLPELDQAGQRRLVRKSLVETGKAMLESGALWFRPGQQALQLIRRVEGHELVQTALEQGRGVILATPHLGAWEAAGLYGAATFNMTCLYRPLRIAELEGLVRSARTRLGANYVPATPGGIRSLCKTLEQGGTIAMLPDQEPQSGAGIFAAFFNRPAWTMTLLARLARRSGAPVVFAWCERLRRGQGYILHFSAAPDEIGSYDLNTATNAMNRALEELVRLCPSQYQWGYRRFRTRPDSKPAIYTGS